MARRASELARGGQRGRREYGEGSLTANSVEGGPRSFLEALPQPQAVLLAIQQRVRRAVHGLATGWHRDRRSPRAAAVPDPRASGPQDLAPGTQLRNAH